MYTKGNWKLDLRPDDNVNRIWAGLTSIADVFGTNDEDKANARLIAAAPSLYEELVIADEVICQLCKRLNPQHAQSPEHNGCESCGARVTRLKAIAKAEGK